MRSITVPDRLALPFCGLSPLFSDSTMRRGVRSAACALSVSTGERLALNALENRCDVHPREARAVAAFGGADRVELLLFESEAGAGASTCDLDLKAMRILLADLLRAARRAGARPEHSIKEPHWRAIAILNRSSAPIM